MVAQAGLTTVLSHIGFCFCSADKLLIWTNGVAFRKQQCFIKLRGLFYCFILNLNLESPYPSLFVSGSGTTCWLLFWFYQLLFWFYQVAWQNCAAERKPWESTDHTDLWLLWYVVLLIWLLLHYYCAGLKWEIFNKSCIRLGSGVKCLNFDHTRW